MLLKSTHITKQWRLERTGTVNTESVKAPEKELSDEEVWERDVKVERLESQIRHLKRVNKQAVKEKAAIDRLVEAVTDAVKAAEPVKPPAKISGRKPSGTEHSLIALFSDAHVGEVVSPAETNNLSAYDMEIFEERMQIWTNKVVELVTLKRSELNIPRLELFMLGDIVSGSIHEELEISNEDNVIGQMVAATHHVSTALLQLAQHFDEITVSVVAGNHGRMKRRPYFKQKQGMNWDTLIGQLLRLTLANQPNVKFILPGSHWMIRSVEGWRFLLMHGDGIRGWAGLPWYGITRAVASFREMIGADIHFDRVVMGHFHNPVNTEAFHVNGCMKGGDEYSIGAIYAAGRPSQTLLYVHPKHGVVSNEIIYLDGGRREFQVIDGSWNLDVYGRLEE